MSLGQMAKQRNSMTEYVCGFLMDYEATKFILINKGSFVTPSGTVLKWAGIGGKISKQCLIDHKTQDELMACELNDHGELPKDAMTREFIEETGSIVSAKRWHCFHIKRYGKDTKIYFFVSFASPSELASVLIAAASHKVVEGEVKVHTLVDVYFDPQAYTFDLSYLITMILYELKAGFLMKLDPEGINSAKHIS
jgi:8-oxo-dGTP pyrophosphatase MutT (NUDIX family)